MADLKKVRAAALKKSGKSGNKSSNLKYAIWIGGAVGSIIVAIVILLLNPDKGPFQTPVNDQGLISHVNRNAKTWMAGASSFFDGWTVGDVRTWQGLAVSQRKDTMQPCQVPDIIVPEQFDARTMWPQCFNSPIYTMGNCTASWAIASASVLSNRFCVSDPAQYADLMLSPQELLSCDHINQGCGGGYIDTAWLYMAREGLVSELCFPYQSDDAVSCKSKCTTEKPLKAASSCALQGEEAIKREIFANGPVVGMLFLVDDFLVYKGGLYQEMSTAKHLTGHDMRRNRLVHAVKVLGWGTQSGKNYWLIENSWGEDWGENGFAKIIRGGNHEKRESVILETFMMAGTPASAKVSYFDDGVEDISKEDGEYDEDIDLDEDIPGEEEN